MILQLGKFTFHNCNAFIRKQLKYDPDEWILQDILVWLIGHM